MIRKILFNNGVTTVGINFTFSRGDTAIAEDGSTLAANQPRFSSPKLLLPAPALTERHIEAAIQNQRVWGGRWKDGSPCLVERWVDNAFPTQGTHVGVSVGSYPPVSSRIKNIGIDPSLVSDSGWRHDPVAFVIAEGVVLAFCRAFEGTVPKAVSVCFWRENVAGQGGATEWALKYRGPSVQDGKARGRDWMAQGPFVPPNGTDANGALLDFFVTWVDYRANDHLPNQPGSLGGQLFIMRCTRASATDNWTLHDAVFLYEDVIPNPPLVPDLFMHFHSASVTFPDVGTESPKRMVVTLAVGDSFPNNRLVNISRSDYTQYREGWTGQSAPVAARPSPDDAFPPDSPTQNGWTTYEDREGQRLRTVFSGCTYFEDAGVKKLGPPSAFTNLSGSIAGITPFIISAGATPTPQTVGVTGKDGSGNLILNRAIASPITNGVGGYLASTRGVQGVWQAPTNDRKTIVHGGDEQGNVVYRYSITDPAERVDLAIAHGVMTDAASGYPVGGSDKNLGWLGLLGAFRLGGTGPDYAVTDYLALMNPNSYQGWVSESRAQTILYSADGLTWGEMFAPNYPASGDPPPDAQVPSAFFGAEVFVGRANNAGLYSIPKPRVSPETNPNALVARPLAISPGATNLLRYYAPDSPEVREIERYNVPPNTNNIFDAVDRSLLGSTDPTYGAIPKPPCDGPIMRVTVVDHESLGVWKLTDSFQTPNLRRLRVRFWVYRMPAAPTVAGPNDIPPSSEVGIGCFPGFVANGELFFGPTTVRPNYLESGRVAGTGWTPVTWYTDPGTYFDPDPPPPTFRFEAWVFSLNTQFERQDFLIAWDCVIAEQDSVELPSRPMLQIPAPPPPPPPPATSQVSLREEFTAVYHPAISPSPPEWSVFAALRLPDSGPDVFTANRIADPDDITLFTLRESPSKYLRIVLERGTSTNRIKLFDHTGASAAVEGPASGDDGVGFAQPFFFLRGRQVLLGVSRYASGESHFYRVWASAGGSRVKVVDGITLADVRPTQARSGDNTKSNPDPAEFFGFWFDDTIATSAADGRAKLHNPTLFLS